MPRVSRTRRIEAPVEAVWAVVSDPYHLPRWWPRTVRVENVHKVRGGRRSQWTKVLETERGSTVRADYRCTGATERERYAWRQDVAGTPFERILRASEIEVRLAPGDAGTKVTITSAQALRGLSRLGGPMMRRATRRTLDEALGDLDAALTEPGGEREDGS